MEMVAALTEALYHHEKFVCVCVCEDKKCPETVNLAQAVY